MQSLVLFAAIGSLIFSAVQAVAKADLGIPKGITVPALVSGTPERDSETAKAAPFVGDCFSFRGRAQFFNGNPSLRIWRVGTKSYIGVSDYRCGALPTAFEKEMKTFGDIVYGDFTVCPLSKFKKGEMQFACIRDVKIRSVVHNNRKD